LILHQTDRHEKNFGYIENETGEKRFAPFFDNGTCLGAFRKANELINQEDMKLPSKNREKILEQYFYDFEISSDDNIWMIDELQEVYEHFFVPEERFQIAVSELVYGVELIEKVQNKNFSIHNNSSQNIDEIIENDNLL
jgi:hypothetical protein